MKSGADLLAAGGDAGATQGGQDMAAEAGGATQGSQGAAGAGQGDAGQGGAVERIEWLGDAPDELHEFAKANGYKSVADALTNTRELQKYLGADKAGRGIVVPKDEADAEGWGQVYAKLGRPETPEGYGLDKLEGADPAFAGEAAKAMHELGLSASQATKLAEWWGKQSTASVEASQAKFLETAAADMTKLEQEWGKAAEQNKAVAARGAKALGFTREELDQIERAVGTRALMERFLSVGAKLGEDAMPGGGGAAAGLTMDGAKAQIEAKMNDKAFMAKVTAGDGAAKAEFDRLFKAAYPE